MRRRNASCGPWLQLAVAAYLCYLSAIAQQPPIKIGMSMAADRRTCRRRQVFADRHRDLARRRQRQGRPARPQGRAGRL